MKVHKVIKFVKSKEVASSCFFCYSFGTVLLRSLSFAGQGAYSFNGKTSVSKTAVPGSSPGGPAKLFIMAKVVKLELSGKHIHLSEVLHPLLLSLVTRKTSLIFWIRMAIFIKGKPDSRSSRIVKSFLASYEEDLPPQVVSVLSQSILPDIQTKCWTVRDLLV